MILSPTEIALLFGGSIFCFILFYFFEKEIQKNSFLTNKIQKINIDDPTSDQSVILTSREQKIYDLIKEYPNAISYKTIIKVQNLLYLLSGVIILFLFPLIELLSVVVFIILTLVIQKAPQIYANYLYDKKISLIEKQFPIAIKQMISMLKTNLTVNQCFDAIGKDFEYPLGEEFKKIHLDITTGASMEKALSDFHKRVPLNTISLFSTGILISEIASQEVILQTTETLLNTIINKNTETKEIKSSTAKNKYTGIIISLLPIICFIGLNIISPNYYTEFLASDTGKLVLFIGFVLNGIGFLVINKMADPKGIVKN